MSSRVAVRVEGVVQGVGFRPFIFRLAEQERLVGFVTNDSGGVTLEIEGAEAAITRFLARLEDEAPAISAIERVTVRRADPQGERDFSIAPSRVEGAADVPVASDTATCAACLAEVVDRSDRRYRYPLINCTGCGPRFSLVRGVPYDRPRTTMAAFVMCALCQAEYDDPRDRRFHAQPNACPVCGPQLRWCDRHGADLPSGALDPLAAAAGTLAAGAVVAVKGIGGYHLACLANDAAAVSALRRRKHRADKPFALMVADVEAAARLLELGATERALLTAPGRPILLARRRTGAAVAPEVAPRSGELGVVLAYSALHVLLLDDLVALGADPVLVMTSGNVSDEPIAYRDEDALARLGSIADGFLLHDRPIHIRTDDSVVRVVRRQSGDRPQVLRRSRGLAPAALTLPVQARRPLLACGAEQKSVACVARSSRAWLTHHIGDLDHAEVRAAFVEAVEHFEHLFAVTPQLLACDRHPDYASSAFAHARAGPDLVEVQHHHAHLAACLAEQGEAGPAIGAIFDGTGYGGGGAIWGGELLVGSLTSCERVGRLHPVRLPGGDRAVREPWRMACAWLQETFGDAGDVPAALREQVSRLDWTLVSQLAGDPGLAPATTSMGRLFDAVGALCGIGAHASYEGQIAVELEAAADSLAADEDGYPIRIARGEDGLLELDPRPALRSIVDALAAGEAVGVVSARFHRGVAEATVGACATSAREHGLDLVVLSGGVMQNRLLLEDTCDRLEKGGLRVLVPERVPPNDGGIAFGQAAIAAALDAR